MGADSSAAGGEERVDSRCCIDSMGDAERCCVDISGKDCTRPCRPRTEGALGRRGDQVDTGGEGEEEGLGEEVVAVGEGETDMAKGHKTHGVRLTSTFNTDGKKMQRHTIAADGNEFV